MRTNPTQINGVEERASHRHRRPSPNARLSCGNELRIVVQAVLRGLLPPVQGQRRTEVDL